MQNESCVTTGAKQGRIAVNNPDFFKDISDLFRVSLPELEHAYFTPVLNNFFSGGSLGDNVKKFSGECFYENGNLKNIKISVKEKGIFETKTVTDFYYDGKFKHISFNEKQKDGYYIKLSFKVGLDNRLQGNVSYKNKSTRYYGSYNANAKTESIKADYKYKDGVLTNKTVNKKVTTVEGYSVQRSYDYTKENKNNGTKIELAKDGSWENIGDDGSDCEINSWKINITYPGGHKSFEVLLFPKIIANIRLGLARLG